MKKWGRLLVASAVVAVTRVAILNAFIRVRAEPRMRGPVIAIDGPADRPTMRERSRCNRPLTQTGRTATISFEVLSTYTRTPAPRGSAAAALYGIAPLASPT